MGPDRVVPGTAAPPARFAATAQFTAPSLFAAATLSSAAAHFAAAALFAAVALFAAPAAAQESAIKGGVSIARFEGTGPEAAYWDEQLVTGTWAGHIRLRFWHFTLQPELHLITKGAAASQPWPPQLESDQLRIEYIEIPLNLVLPLRVGPLEPYVMGGPVLMLESRCRTFIVQDNLRTNLPCDPRAGEHIFERTIFDWGVTGAVGARYPLLGGRVLIEARHTRGMRDVHRRPGDAELFNRSFAILVGYAVGWEQRNP